MINKDIFRKIVIITVALSLFFSFSLLVSATDANKAESLKLNNSIIFLDDGDEDSSVRGLSIEDLINLVQEATSKHLTILQEVLENAPEPAKKGIERAIEVSVRGSTKAIKALSKIKVSNKDIEDNGQKTFHIVSSCNRGGTIEPKGIQFSQGESVGFIIAAEEGYELVWVRVDNKKLGAISSYSFDDIGRNHTIHAHFKKVKDSSSQNDID